MMVTFESIKADSVARISELQEKVATSFDKKTDFNKRLCIFACGSLGRHEISKKSDLDLFFILNGSDQKKNNEEMLCSNLEKYLFFSKMYGITKSLGYSDPSNDGSYWDFISNYNLLDIGSRAEDFTNGFTARMLLILESKPIHNLELYNKLISSVISSYFKDYSKHKHNFYPLFLMNDILRYWYTLTLNYEYRRDENHDKNKKYWNRLKLKYARLITCYSMLACLYTPSLSPDYVIDCIELTPFERLHQVAKESERLQELVRKAEIEYNWFLQLRNESSDWWNNTGHKSEAFQRADEFHDIIVHQLMRTVSDRNPQLKEKMDLY